MYQLKFCFNFISSVDIYMQKLEDYLSEKLLKSTFSQKPKFGYLISAIEEKVSKQ